MWYRWNTSWAVFRDLSEAHDLRCEFLDGERGATVLSPAWKPRGARSSSQRGGEVEDQGFGNEQELTF